MPLKSEMFLVKDTDISELLLEVNDMAELVSGCGSVGAHQHRDLRHVAMVRGQFSSTTRFQVVVSAGESQLHLVQLQQTRPGQEIFKGDMLTIVI